MRFVSASIGATFIVGLAACGGSTPPAQTTTTTATAAPPSGAPGPAWDGIFREMTQGQVKVGHFASADGTVGLVLDRTGPTPKLRIDGSSDVIELTVSSEGVDARVDHWLFLAPDGHTILTLDARSGSLRFVSPRAFNGIAINSDKAADPLPEATVRGQYKAPANANDEIRKRLAALAVQTKFSQFQPEDSGNLAKIGEAFTLATPDMLVHINAAGAAAAAWAPASYHIGTEYRGDSTSFAGRGEEASDAWDKGKPGLMKYGIKYQADPVQFGQFALHERHLKGWPQPLAAGTPGVVWEIYQNGSVVFVAVDGGRYEISVDGGTPVDPGWGPVSSWPPPMQHSALDGRTVALLAKANAIPDQARADLERLEAGWTDCVQGVWKETQAQIDKVEASSLPIGAKIGKATGIRKTAEESVPAKCGPKITPYEAALVKLTESRNADRKALFDKASARAPK